jgi:putative flippase GtrA
MERFYELLRYGAVGLVNALTNLGLYSAMVLVGVPYTVAAVAAFPLPLALGYWLHEHWTFRRGEPTAARLGAFAVLQCSALGISVLLLAVCVDGFGVAPVPARLITVPLAPIFVYLVSRAVIFARPRRNTRAQPEPRPERVHEFVS